LSLLWRGILQVSQALQASALFGCSSLNTQSALEMAQALSALHRLKAWDASAPVRVCSPYDPEAHGLSLPDPLTLPPGKIPPLILSYVRAGAKVLGRPAFDAEFQCFDVLTWLEPETLSVRHRKRWGSA
jgi:putative hemolysin